MQEDCSSDPKDSIARFGLGSLARNIRGLWCGVIR